MATPSKPRPASAPTADNDKQRQRRTNGRPAAPVATPTSVGQGNGFRFLNGVDVIVGRVGVSGNPLRRVHVRVEAPCELHLMIALEPSRKQIERAWSIACRTDEAVAYVRREIAKLMRELDGVVLVDAE